MKRQVLIFFLIGIHCFTFFGCDKEKNDDPIHEGVELYLINSFETLGNTSQIDETTVVAEDIPLVSYSNFISYDSSNYIFKISDDAKEAIQNLEHSVHGIAFAFKANNKLIYTGYFWPSYSSLICDWVFIDPVLLFSGNEIKVKLGYPSPMEGQVIPDKRNNSQIIEIFERDNKLIIASP